MAGVSTRTLRYYDEIGLLKPARVNSKGYRIYGSEEVDRLQQILFFRQLGVNLKSIKKILDSPSYDRIAILHKHRETITKKQEQLLLLIENLDRTIEASEGTVIMNDEEKFEGLKKHMVEENERKYGKEIREKCGDIVADLSNAQFLEITEQDYKELTYLENEFKRTLAKAFKLGDPASSLAQKACELHHKWLCYFGGTYTKEAHANVGQMYFDDPRFTSYYDQDQQGTTKFLRDALLIYTKLE